MPFNTPPAIVYLGHVKLFFFSFFFEWNKLFRVILFTVYRVICFFFFFLSYLSDKKLRRCLSKIDFNQSTIRIRLNYSQYFWTLITRVRYTYRIYRHLIFRNSYVHIFSQSDSKREYTLQKFPYTRITLISDVQGHRVKWVYSVHRWNIMVENLSSNDCVSLYSCLNVNPVNGASTNFILVVSDVFGKNMLFFFFFLESAEGRLEVKRSQ